jgi:hypothetical protein
MDPATLLTILGLGALAWLAVQRGRVGRQRDLSDILSGLFGRTGELGWPTGVQEEDSIRPWGVVDGSGSGSSGPGGPNGGGPADGSSDSEMPGSDAAGQAVVEDGVEPIEVARVRRAA